MYLKTRGFTLVEILVAAVILTVIAGGLFSGFVISKKYIRLGYHRLQALNIARQYLESLRTEVNATTWNNDSTNNLTIREYVLNPIPINNIIFYRSCNVSFIDINTNGLADDDEPRKATFSVTWDEP